MTAEDRALNRIQPITERFIETYNGFRRGVVSEEEYTVVQSEWLNAYNRALLESER